MSQEQKWTPELSALVEQELMEVLARRYGAMPLGRLRHAARSAREAAESAAARPVPNGLTHDQELIRYDEIQQAVRDGRCPCDGAPLGGAQVKDRSPVWGTQHRWTFEHTDGRQHDDQLTWRS